ncbi:aminoacyl-tRNA hydrolase [Solicola sp. PLA-1-18]|uniref:aminoacyl-tRNA hydrolase n=1 Tax=Solicola sp. PLA-1-18 TaxID=3380532 RepID=UPI003B77BD06
MTEAVDGPWLVVGLGNAGAKYADTRHNIGVMVCDLIAGRVGSSWKRDRSGLAEVVESRLGIGGPRVVLARSRGYMNESGGPVSALSKFYGVPAGRVVAVHDELDLDLGRLRVKLGGGDNGHNGLRSMRASLGTGDFLRVRVGVGRPPGRQDPADYVLKPFARRENADLDEVVDRAADAVGELVTHGLEHVQNAYNR